MLGAVRAVLRRHPWLIPIAFALALGAAGWLNMRSLETTLRAQVRTHLETVLKADVAALEIWARAQRAVAVRCNGRTRHTPRHPAFVAGCRQLKPVGNSLQVIPIGS